MGLIELLMVALSVSMDAFAVALGKGLCMKSFNIRHAAIIAAFFGGFQAANPLVGWLVGRQFEQSIRAVDHWLAFGLLALIGAKMLHEAYKSRHEVPVCAIDLDFRELLVLSVATSIDALAIGVTFAFLQVDILPSVALIGVITFLVSFAGVAIGNQFGVRYKTRAEIVGGIVLILIGTRILLEHLGVQLPFEALQLLVSTGN